jgi:hypothetical protein
MFTEEQLYLLSSVCTGGSRGSRLFAASVKKQGFMTRCQQDCLCHMHNSIKPWSSRSSGGFIGSALDHDDLQEGWDGC